MPIPVATRRPEDAELAKKNEKLAGLQSRLADLELELFTLHLELTEFESLYCAKVGPIYAELDELDALIAERIAQRRPGDTRAAEAASTARRHADETRQAASDALTVPVQPPARSDSLRDLYKDAAKRIHPDFARDEADRKVRERLMTEANLAYARGDEASLRAILEEYDSSPDTVLGTDIAAELVRVIRRISLADKRIQQINAQIAELKASELFTLKNLVEDGQQTGKDVLGDMVGRLKQQVAAKREYLRTL
jgi:hypothetical protein